MDPTALLAKYNLSMGEITATAAIVTFTVALLKKHLGWKGKMAFIGAVLATVVWTAITYLPIPTPVVAGVFVLVVSTGGWQTAKDLIGKVGEDNADRFRNPPSK